MPAVTEDYTRARYEETIGGLSAQRVFEVEASTMIDAVAVLGREKRVSIGSTYTSAHGEGRAVPWKSIVSTPKTQAPHGGTGLFELVCQGRTGQGGALAGSPDPTTPGRVVTAFTSTRADAQVTTDKDGKLIQNYLGQIQRVTVPIVRATVNARWYGTEMTIAKRLLVFGAYNSQPMWGIDPEKWLLGGLSAIEDSTGASGGDNDGLVQWSANFEYKADGWPPKVQQVATQEVIETLASGEKVLGVAGVAGEKLSDPRPINPDGTFKAAGEEADILEVDKLEPVDFASILGWTS